MPLATSKGGGLLRLLLCQHCTLPQIAPKDFNAMSHYNGGLLGGILPALALADLGGGEFDGAHLVSNFELLSIPTT